MKLRWKIFIALVLLFTTLIILDYISENPILTIIAYMMLAYPAFFLSEIGLPTLVIKNYDFVPGISLLGYIADIIIYLILFYLIGWVLELIWNKIRK